MNLDKTLFAHLMEFVPWTGSGKFFSPRNNTPRVARKPAVHSCLKTRHGVQSQDWRGF